MPDWLHPQTNYSEHREAICFDTGRRGKGSIQECLRMMDLKDWPTDSIISKMTHGKPSLSAYGQL